MGTWNLAAFDRAPALSLRRSTRILKRQRCPGIQSHRGQVCIRCWDQGNTLEYRDGKGNSLVEPTAGNQRSYGIDATGKQLLLVRVETMDGVLPPLARVPWEEHPRVARAYDLLGPRPTTPLIVINDCMRDILVDLVAPDATYCVVRGTPDPMRPLRRWVRVLDCHGWKELRVFPRICG
jgi:hypothetical protein